MKTGKIRFCANSLTNPDSQHSRYECDIQFSPLAILTHCRHHAYISSSVCNVFQFPVDNRMRVTISAHLIKTQQQALTIKLKSINKTPHVSKQLERRGKKVKFPPQSSSLDDDDHHHQRRQAGREHIDAFHKRYQFWAMIYELQLAPQHVYVCKVNSRTCVNNHSVDGGARVESWKRDC